MFQTFEFKLNTDADLQSDKPNEEPKIWPGRSAEGFYPRIFICKLQVISAGENWTHVFMNNTSCFVFQNGTMSKMTKFEIELPVIPKPAKLSLSERDIAMATM